MSDARVRFGFMSTAAITAKNRRAIAVAKEAVTLTAVGSRDVKRAEEWAEAASKDGFAVTAHGSYEALLADPNCDAIYMPLPCSLHVEWVLKAAAAGKHVLVEKPTAVSLQQLEDMITACRKAGVLFMDGTMFSHCSRLAKMSPYVLDGGMGPLRRAVSGFSFLADDEWLATNIRTKKALEPFGSLGDLGWYQLRFALWARGWELPTSVSCVSHSTNADGVPLDVTGTVVWARDGFKMTFDCSFLMPFRQWVEVVGTTGVLKLDDFVITRSHKSCEFTVVTDPRLDETHSNVLGERKDVELLDVNQEADMFRDFAAAVAAGPAAHVQWAKQSLLTQAVLDACQASVDAAGASVPVKVPSISM